MMSYQHVPKLIIRVHHVAMLFACSFIFGCAAHGVPTYVRNDSKLTVKFEISGAGKPWTSNPIPPGGKEQVDREFGEKAENVHLSVVDTATGKTLIIEHLGNDLAKTKPDSEERVITYPPSP
jgi:hypothetical protein